MDPSSIISNNNNYNNNNFIIIRDWLYQVNDLNIKMTLEGEDLCRSAIGGTRKWVLSLLDNWMDNIDSSSTSTNQSSSFIHPITSSNRILWIHGEAGAGKSIVSGMTARHLRIRNRLASLFLWRLDQADRCVPKTLVLSLALSLANWDNQFALQLLDVRDALPGLPSHPHAEYLWQKLIFQPLNNIPKYEPQLTTFTSTTINNAPSPNSSSPSSLSPATTAAAAALGKIRPRRPCALLFDGLDECPLSLRGPFLRLFTRLSRTLPPFIKIILTSRPEPDIHAALSSTATCLNLSPSLDLAGSSSSSSDNNTMDNNEDNISSAARALAASLHDDALADIARCVDLEARALGLDNVPAARARILALSGGRFIWLRLAFDSLRHTLGERRLKDPSAGLTAYDLDSLPASLDGMYILCLSRLMLPKQSNDNSPSQAALPKDLAHLRDTMSSIVVAAGSMTPLALAGLLEVPLESLTPILRRLLPILQPESLLPRGDLGLGVEAVIKSMRQLAANPSLYSSSSTNNNNNGGTTTPTPTTIQQQQQQDPDTTRIPVVRLISASVAEHLTNPSRTLPSLHVDARETHAWISRRCLAVLSSRLRRNPAGLDPTLLAKEIPRFSDRARFAVEDVGFLGYAVKYWVSHVCGAGGGVDEELHGLAEQFLRSHSLHWVEACYLVNAPVLVHLLNLQLWGESFSRTGKRSLVAAVAYDLLRLLPTFDSLLASSPGQLYTSAMLWCPVDTQLSTLFRGSPDHANWMTLSPSPSAQSGMTPSSVLATPTTPTQSSVLSSSSSTSLSPLSLMKPAKILLGLPRTYPSTYLAHQGHATAVSFSPDARRLCTTSLGGGITVWDSFTGEPLARCVTDLSDSLTSTAVSGGVVKGSGKGTRWNSVSWDMGGAWVAAASGEGLVWVWHSGTGEVVKVFDGHVRGLEVSGVCFSPVLSADSNAGGGMALATALAARGVAASRWLASSSWDATIRIWDVKNGTCACVLQNGMAATCVTYHPTKQGNILACGSRDGSVRVWDVSRALVNGGDGGEVMLALLRCSSGPVMSVTFDPVGDRIAAGSSDASVSVWNVRDVINNNNQVSSPVSLDTPMHKLTNHTGPVYAVAFSPDGGRQLATGSSDLTLQLWDLSEPTTAKSMGVMRTHASDVRAIGFSPNGARAASASSDGSVRVWDLWNVKSNNNKTNTTSMVSSPPAEDDVLLGCVNPILSGGEVAPAHRDTITCTSWSGIVAGLPPHTRRFVSGSDDRTVKVWDVLDASHSITNSTTPPVQPSARLKGHYTYVTWCLASPTGTHVLSASDDGIAKLWALDDGQAAKAREELRTTGGTVDPFSADATGCIGGSEILELPAGTMVHPAAFSECGRFVAAGVGSKDVSMLGFVRVNVWEVSLEDRTRVTPRAALIGRLQDNGGGGGGDEQRAVGVTAVAFGADTQTQQTRWVAGSCEDGVVRVWDLQSGTQTLNDGTTVRSAAFELRTVEDAEVLCVAFSGTSLTGTLLLACGTSNGGLVVWDFSRPQQPPTTVAGIEEAHLGSILSVYVSTAKANGSSFVATGSDDGTVKLWDARSESLTLITTFEPTQSSSSSSSSSSSAQRNLGDFGGSQGTEADVENAIDAIGGGGLADAVWFTRVSMTSDLKWVVGSGFTGTGHSWKVPETSSGAATMRLSRLSLVSDTPEWIPGRLFDEGWMRVGDMSWGKRALWLSPEHRGKVVFRQGGRYLWFSSIAPTAVGEGNEMVPQVLNFLARQ